MPPDTSSRISGEILYTALHTIFWLKGHSVLNPNKNVLMLVVTSLFLGAQSLFAQVDEATRQNIELAYQMGDKLVAARESLPDRWAARQDRKVVGGQQETEVTAFASGTSYQNVWHHGQGPGDPFNLRTERFIAEATKLQRFRGKEWKAVEAFARTGPIPSDPFSWCIGFLNTARLGRLTEDTLERFFDKSKRKCIAAWFEKDFKLTTLWVLKESKTPAAPVVTEIVFDTKRKLIDRVANHRFGEQANLENYFAGKYETLSEADISWRSFEVSSSKGDTKREILVPVDVHIVSSIYTGYGEIEYHNAIQWLFDEDVPDSQFSDPRSSDFKEIAFPDRATDDGRKRNETSNQCCGSEQG